MTRIKDDNSASSYLIRPVRPGDMGTIISRHGSIYVRDFDWSPKFEADCARLCADIIDNIDPNLECCWIAESTANGNFFGSVALLKDRSGTDAAQLRLFLVDPAARGKGLGARLIDECVRFARDKGYAKLILWTFDCLEGARRLYRRAGFELVQSHPEKETFGRIMAQETWLLGLSSPETSSSDLPPSSDA